MVTPKKKQKMDTLTLSPIFSATKQNNWSPHNRPTAGSVRTPLHHEIEDICIKIRKEETLV